MLILAVGLARLGLSLAGLPNSTTRWLTMNGVYFIGVLYLAIRVHTTGFGTYKHLLPSLVLPSLVFHGVAILGIALGIITGHDNVFTAPEYSFGAADGKTLAHLAAHAFIGLPAQTLVNWLIGCLILFVTRKLVARKK